MNRTLMRENAFRLLYSLEVQKNKNLNIEEQINLYVESNQLTDQEAIEYIKDVITGVEKNKIAIKALIESNLKSNWKIDRISKIDLSLLELAIYEIKYKEVPFKVSINEVVELAKKYGEENSKTFVNGVLASIVKD